MAHMLEVRAQAKPLNVHLPRKQTQTVVCLAVQIAGSADTVLWHVVVPLHVTTVYHKHGYMIAQSFCQLYFSPLGPSAQQHFCFFFFFFLTLVPAVMLCKVYLEDKFKIMNNLCTLGSEYIVFQ